MRDRDWADSEDHDFLNGYVGQRIDRIETGEDELGEPWLEIWTNRGQVLRILTREESVLDIESD